MNDVTLPAYGSFWAMGDTIVVVHGTSKRGRGYQVHIEVPVTGVTSTVRLKDFLKKATPNA